jgi:hypothetical protein
MTAHSARWLAAHGVKGETFTDSPYYGKRRVRVVDARKHCAKHVTLTLEDGREMLVDDTWPISQDSRARGRKG